MKKNIIYAWACDFSSFRGEGILARDFAQDISRAKNVKIIIKSPENKYLVSNKRIKKITKTYKKKINFGLLENYLWPIYGLLYLWKLYFQNKKIIYLNFMPLWNFLLFYFLPPKTIVGPITGFLPKKKIENFSNLIRIILIPTFYNLSLFIIFKRFNNLIFSTDLLKAKFSRKKFSKLYFNYLIFSNIKFKKKEYKEKKIDLLIYNRNYSVKEHFKLNNLIKYLIKKKYNVECVGDELKIKGLKNNGIISRIKTQSKLKKTKVIISSPENPYSLFTMDAINMGTKILFDIKYNKKLSFIKYNPKHYINIDDQKYLQIEDFINKNDNHIKLNIKSINLTKKRINKYLKNLII